MTTVPDVETLHCPNGGNHQLTNAASVTLCRCGSTWAELDAAARRPARKTTPTRRPCACGCPEDDGDTREMPAGITVDDVVQALGGGS